MSHAEPSKMDDHIQRFLNGKPFITPKTVAWYSNAFNQYRKVVGDEWPPTEDHLNTFFSKIAGQGLKPATIDNYFRAIRAWLNWLHKRRLIEQNPIELMDRPPKGVPLPRAPHLDDVRRLFEVLTDMADLRWEYCRDLALFSLAIDTGGRIGELATLTVRDVELKQGEIFIKATKTRRQRNSVFGPQTEDEVKRWLECRATLDVPPNIEAFFVSKHRGIWRSLTHWGMRQALNKWCKLARINQFNFHALRHAYAIFSLRNHADLLDVQHQLGHRRLSTTSIYTQVVNLGRHERHSKTSPRNFLSISS